MEGHSQGYVGMLGPSVSWGLDYSVALVKLGAADLCWGGPPGPFLQFCCSRLYEQTPLERRAVRTGSRHLATLPDRSSPHGPFDISSWCP